jgi:hypothetical protein
MIIVAMSTGNVTADETKWIAIGDLHNWYSSAGSEREVGRRGLISDQQDGLRWPALYDWQDTQAAKGLWIGAANYRDTLANTTFNYKVVHVGPRVLNEGSEIMPQEFRMLGRFENPQVYVEGVPASDLRLNTNAVDEIDPALPADRVLVCRVNTAMGITVTRKIHAFTHSDHDNYHIYDYVFKNTGIVDNSGTTHQQTLTDVVFFFLHRYAPTREAGSYGLNIGPQSINWGHSTVNNALSQHPVTSDPFRAQFAWLGLHSNAAFNIIGGPDDSNDGHLTASQYVGHITLHADTSPTNSGDDVNQPSTTMYFQSDLAIMSGNNQFDAGKMAAEYAAMTAGHPANTMADDMGCPNPYDCQTYADTYLKPGDPGNPGGYSQGQGFGPYTLAPGDSIRIVMAEGVAGLSREMCFQVGAEWKSGIGPFQLPDKVGGGTTTDADEYKNAWVYTGEDSLIQTFERAIANYSGGYAISNPPPPPMLFDVVPAQDRISLFWDTSAESWPKFAGYRVFRAVGRDDTAYQEIFACGPGTANPTIVNSFEDLTAVRGLDYYYYIQTFDDGTNVEGYSLHSSLFWTRTNAPAHLADRIYVEADLYVSPTGSDTNSGLTAEDPFLTITTALDTIMASTFQPRTIHLAAGTYSPSATGETFPLIGKSFVTLSGAGKWTTILDAEGTSRVLKIYGCAGTSVDSLTVRHGKADVGGGILVDYSELALSSVAVVNDTADMGGGIYAGLGGRASMSLADVTIMGNFADYMGGGIYSMEGELLFDPDNRSNIYGNQANIVGADIHSRYYAPQTIVIVDTFSVMTPSDYHACPTTRYTFDILNAKEAQIHADVYVSPLGDDANSGLSAGEPFRTIKQAIRSVYATELNPRTIHLADGTYSPSTTGERYPLYCRNFVSISGSSQAGTILDAEQTWCLFEAFEDHGYTIENATLQHGTFPAGGGMWIEGSAFNLANVTLQDNTSDAGGGLYLTDSAHVSLSNVTIRRNSSATAGGGILLGDGSQITFDNVSRSNIYLNESAEVGSDIYAFSSIPTLAVIVDTFTVVYPIPQYAAPLEYFTFDILNYKVKQEEADLYISPGGNDANTGLASNQSLLTITHALDLIFADEARPHTIHLAEGIYSPSSTGEIYPLNLKGYVSLAGASEATTILDAESTAGVLLSEDAHGSGIENLTISGGLAQSGGGIFCSASILSLAHVTLTANIAVNGGGIYLQDGSHVSLDSVTIVDNVTTGAGGGIYSMGSSPLLSNVTISRNSSGGRIGGGGLRLLDNSHPTVANTIFWGNTPREIECPSGGVASTLTVSYSNIKGGEAFIILQNGTVDWQAGNIDADPLFCKVDSGNYTLAENSPCVGTGEGGVNMGARPVACGPIVSVLAEDLLPQEFNLHPNYPNPFNPSTAIRYDLPYPTEVRLVIYNLLGREMVHLVHGYREVGYHSVTWQGLDVSGRTVPSGIYIIRLVTPQYTKSIKMVLLK